MTQPKPKLTVAQKNIVELMKQGWALGYCNTMKLCRGGWSESSRYYLQKGRLRRGGETKNIRMAQFYSLCKKGIIKPKNDDFSIKEWELTEIGKGEAMPQKGQ